MERPTLIFGHKNPDTDSICSTLSFTEYQKKIGNENVEAVCLGEIRPETQYALDQFKVSPPRLIEGNVAKEADHVMLVDHNEFGQSATGIEEVVIDAVIDHHRISDFKTAGPLFYRAEPVGCTSTILYKLYKERGIQPSAEIAGLMMSAIISDTLLFKSPTCTEEDQKAAEALSKICGVELEGYGKDLLKAGASIKGKSATELLHQDAKPFSLGDFSLKIAQINVIGFEDAVDMTSDLIKSMEQEMKDENLDTFFLIVTDIFENNSIGIVTGESSLVEKAFNQKVIDHQINLPGVVSRKKQIVPPLTDAANAN